MNATVERAFLAYEDALWVRHRYRVRQDWNGADAQESVIAELREGLRMAIRAELIEEEAIFDATRQAREQLGEKAQRVDFGDLPRDRPEDDGV